MKSKSHRLNLKQAIYNQNSEQQNKIKKQNKSLIYKVFQNHLKIKNNMENDQQQRQCDNCKKIFPNDKIDLHEAYCFRNIKKCTKCQKMIDVNQLEAHHLDQHTNKQCDLCKQSFQPQVFEQHPDNCPKKPVSCNYCENCYAQQQILKHKQSCGSRTQPCSICQKLIMIKQFSTHQEKCRKRAQQRRVQRVQVSQDAARNHSRNQNQVPSRQRQNSQNVRDRRKSSTSKNVMPKPAKLKPSHMIGPQSMKPAIDPVPISIRLAMKGKDQQRLPLKSKN